MLYDPVVPSHSYSLILKPLLRCVFPRWHSKYYSSSVLLHKQDQSNINATNTNIWGTCNTDISQSQCDQNMEWFVSSLRSSCATDLSDQNLMASGALTGTI